MFPGTLLRCRSAVVLDRRELRTADASGFNNISCSITNGTEGFTGSPFGFPAGIAAGHPLFVFINHTFTVGHNSDGSKTVNFSVQLLRHRNGNVRGGFKVLPPVLTLTLDDRL
jgi:hypothetical protein